jgi:hypothetical protein
MISSSRFYDFQLQKDFNRRPLDWRFRRSLELSRIRGNRRFPRSGDDPLVKRYAEMLWRLNDTSTFEDLNKIRKRYPDLFEIHLVYSTVNQSELALLDGLMLSRSTDPKLISQQSGLTETQQRDYKKMFLDVDDRRHMSLFIASQLMEPCRLRGSLSDSQETEDPTKPYSRESENSRQNGSLSLQAQCVLRVIGFYSSPVVLELLYSGMLTGNVPAGRDSAMRFISQSTLVNIRRHGVLSSFGFPESQDGLHAVFQLAAKLAVEEKETGQIDIIQNIEALLKNFRPRIGNVGEILEEDGIAQHHVSEFIEPTEEDMYRLQQTKRPSPQLHKMETAFRERVQNS